MLASLKGDVRTELRRSRVSHLAVEALCLDLAETIGVPVRSRHQEHRSHHDALLRAPRMFIASPPNDSPHKARPHDMRSPPKARTLEQPRPGGLRLARALGGRQRRGVVVVLSGDGHRAGFLLSAHGAVGSPSLRVNLGRDGGGQN